MYNANQEVIIVTTINERFRSVRLSLEKKMSQEAFAEKIGLSRSELSNIEYGKTEPKEFTIRQVCDQFSVNDLWLRTGEGEMFRELSREEELAKFIGEVMAAESDDFKKRFFAAMSKLSTEEWKLVEKMARELSANDKEG